MSTLRALLRRQGIVRSLGVHDVLSARVAEKAGIETLFVGGFGTSASHLGQPDLNLVTLTEMADAVRRIVARVKVPVVADGDTGHGGPHNVVRTVQEFEAAGAAGVILEDQVAPKRCGHFQGKDVVPVREMVLKWRAAVSARSSREFVLIARTDARDVKGLRDAIVRANLYLRAGADVAFVESPHSARELEAVARGVKGPVLVNMLTGGKTPHVPVSTLQRWGFKIVVYPIESLMTSVQALKRLSRMALEGQGLEGLDMIKFADIKDLLGLPAFLSEERVLGGHHVSR